MADKSLMSHLQARAPSLPLNKFKLKIRRYGYKLFKSSGYYDVTVMYGTTVANIRFCCKSTEEQVRNWV